MNLGIGGRKAIVCAASKGLGRACAFSLAREGVELTLISRTRATLEATADEIRAAHKTKVTIVTGDLATEAAREAVIAACPEPDILITNPGSRQTPADFRTLTREDWLRWYDEHALSALGLIQRVAEGMSQRRFGRIVNITVSFVKFPQIGFAHSHGARAALSAASASIARELIAHNVTINNVLPGLVATDALTTNLHVLAERAGRSYDDIVTERLKTCPAGRFADPAETGDLVAYLCSAQAGFMTAQNIVQDGGVYQGLF